MFVLAQSQQCRREDHLDRHLRLHQCRGTGFPFVALCDTARPNHTYSQQKPYKEHEAVVPAQHRKNTGRRIQDTEDVECLELIPKSSWARNTPDYPASIDLKSTSYSR